MQRIVPLLTEWFQIHRRSLPWRDNPLPYYVWVSEIMLQQTRTEAVKPYFSRFTESLPTVRALADCPEDRLMKLWEGLGYYSRVRNMQKAAMIIMRDYGGIIPPEAPELRKLPGIGSYTAGAISSIAYGRPYAAVDGNVLRVSSRLLADEGCIDDPKVKKGWEDTLNEVIRFYGPSESSGEAGRERPSNFPGTFNQAMMEIGATVCIPNGSPECGRCPLRALCLAHKKGQETWYPVRKPKAARRIEERTVVVIRSGKSAVIRQRDRKGLLAGLWELPNFPGKLSEEKVIEQVCCMGLVPVKILALPEAKHVFSHVEWHMSGFLADAAKPPDAFGDDWIFHDDSGREYHLTGILKLQSDYAVPGAFSAYLRYLGIGRRQDTL